MSSLADTFESNLTQFKLHLQEIKQQREEVLQQIYKLDPWQKRDDFCEKFKLQLIDFNKKLKKVYLEEERRKMIEGKIVSVFILCLNKLNVSLILILKLNLIIEQQSLSLISWSFHFLISKFNYRATIIHSLSALQTLRLW